MTMNTERRNFIAAIGATAASTAVLAGTQALAQGAQQTEAKAIPCLHDPRLQIAERALAEAQEAGEIVVCPDFPSQAARVLHADRGARLTADASSRLVAERGGKRGEERHDALRAQGRAAVGGAQHP
jgi:hypothetical protein